MSDADLNQNYAKAGFAHRLGFGQRPALVIIDFCMAYMIEDSPLYAGPTIPPAAERCAALLAACREAGVPVIHTTVRYTKGGADGGVFFQKAKPLRLFVEGADPKYQAFAPGLEPAAGEPVIVKQYASAFFGTSLASTLTALGVDTVLLTGLSTSGCVRASAVDACQHGFRPMVVREAVGDRDPKVHEANLFDVNAKYGDVISIDEALGYVAQRAEAAE